MNKQPRKKINTTTKVFVLKTWKRLDQWGNVFHKFHLSEECCRSSTVLHYRKRLSKEADNLYFEARLPWALVRGLKPCRTCINLPASELIARYNNLSKTWKITWDGRKLSLAKEQRDYRASKKENPAPPKESGADHEAEGCP